MAGSLPYFYFPLKRRVVIKGNTNRTPKEFPHTQMPFQTLTTITTVSTTMTKSTKPTILHLGDRVEHNLDVYKRFASQFTVIRPSDRERQRDAFMAALKEKRWGEFDAIFRPFWNTGGEMGRWDKELIALLPKSVKVFASAGAGFDWADVDILAEKGLSPSEKMK